MSRRNRPMFVLSIIAAALLAAALVAFLGRRPILRNSGGPRELVVFCADSLDLAFRNLKREFEGAFPGTDIVLEPSGSLLAARKISSGRHCDVLAVADHRVIDDLMPELASWRIDFASNEIVIAGTQMSRCLAEIDGSNWFEVLLREDVSFGRADPDLDPCGYWTLLCWKLADRYYPEASGGKPISERLQRKSPPKGPYMREDTQKLLALVEGMGGIDYAFVYRSQAVDHRLQVVTLPREINLSDLGMEKAYSQVSVEISNRDDPPKTIAGKPIIYALTILNDCRQPESAEKLVRFLLDAPGRAVLEGSGFQPIRPARLGKLPGVKTPDWGALVQEESSP